MITCACVGTIDVGFKFNLQEIVPFVFAFFYVITIVLCGSTNSLFDDFLFLMQFPMISLCILSAANIIIVLFLCLTGFLNFNLSPSCIKRLLKNFGYGASVFLFIHILNWCSLKVKNDIKNLIANYKLTFIVVTLCQILINAFICGFTAGLVHKFQLFLCQVCMLCH